MNLFKKKKSSIDKSEILSISTLQKEIEILLETKINPQGIDQSKLVPYRI